MQFFYYITRDFRENHKNGNISITINMMENIYREKVVEHNSAHIVCLIE